MRRLLLLSVLGVVSLTVLPACTASVRLGGPPTGAPTCPALAGPIPDRLPGPLLLTAQSVPSSSLVPCLRPLPTGWTFQKLDAQNGTARITIDFQHEDSRAATVTLTHTCDVRGATQKASEQRDARRYERTHTVKSGYRGERYYVYLGGCITYRFNLKGSRAEAQVATITASLGFVERELLRRYVHEYSDGRLELDPTAAGGGAR